MEGGVMEAFAATDDLIQLVTFVLGSEEYAVNILKVQEINRMTDITLVPNSPPHVEGVINLRGKVIPVVNLRKKFGMEEKDDNSDSRIMIVDLGGSTMGIIVDAVSEVLRVPPSVLEHTPPMAAEIDTEFISGIAKLQDRLIILLDIDKMVGKSEVNNLF
jgi:purine-binding chemotaxis protein CheW